MLLIQLENKANIVNSELKWLFFFPTRIAQGVHITKEVKLDGYVNSNGMLINAFLVLSQGLPYN